MQQRPSLSPRSEITVVQEVRTTEAVGRSGFDTLNQTSGWSPESPHPSAARKVAGLKSRAVCAKGQPCQGLHMDQGHW